MAQARLLIGQRGLCSVLTGVQFKCRVLVGGHEKGMSVTLECALEHLANQPCRLLPCTFVFFQPLIARSFDSSACLNSRHFLMCSVVLAVASRPHEQT